MVLASPGTGIYDPAQLAADVVGAEEIAADSVGDDEIAAHTTSKITVPTSQLSGTLDIAQFADDVITPDKLENGTQGDVLIAGTGGVFERLGIGTSGHFLKSNGAGANPSWAAGGAEFPVPSANVKQSADTTRSTSNTNYEKLKEIKVNIPGKVRVLHEFRRTSAGTGTSRVYKNGVAIGNENTDSSSTNFNSVSEDFEFVSGDLVQLYAKNPNGSPTEVRNFRIAYDLVASAVPTVVTD